MNITDFNLENLPPYWQEGLLVGNMLLLAIILTMIVLVVFLGIYIYESIAWQRIGRNQKYRCPWMAWIPFARLAMRLEMGRFHWALIFLLLIPILGWIAVFVLEIIALWRIFEKAKYPGWLSLSIALTALPYLGWISSIAYYIIIGFVAWKKR
ncbi:hypothetical protein HOD29_06985 [archaeon]|jgi:hypothetical protein|nr:hypothetical protein [archaeon]